MEPHPSYQMLESEFIEMDPTLDGFEGVLAELCFTGEKYRLTLTAAGSGNQLLDFTSDNPGLAFQMFRQQARKGSQGSQETVGPSDEREGGVYELIG